MKNKLAYDEKNGSNMINGDKHDKNEDIKINKTENIRDNQVNNNNNNGNINFDKIINNHSIVNLIIIFIIKQKIKKIQKPKILLLQLQFQHQKLKILFIQLLFIKQVV